jgi:hypothetical protein
MELDAARALKTELATGVRELLGVPTLAGRSFTVSSIRVKAVDQVQPTIAFGITARPGGGFAVAARVQRVELMHGHHLDELRHRTRGEVDILYVGELRPLQGPDLRSRQRPLLPGVSIAHQDVTAGTLGAFVRDNNGQRFLLSNNHVIANSNSAQPLDPVLQPGPWDNGIPADRVAGLARWIPIDKSSANHLDCAIAALDAGMTYELDGFSGLVVAPNYDLEEQPVWKVGRTSARRRGRVSAVEVDNVVLRYDGLGNIQFNGQVEVESVDPAPFAEPGDSGALVVTDSGHAIGLVFGGTEVGGTNGQGIAYANPLVDVLQALNVTLIA